MRVAAILAAAAILLGLAGAAAAQGMDAAPPGYVEVGGANSGSFVHAGSIRRDGNFREAWQLRNHAVPAYVGGSPYLSSVMLWRFDCVGWRTGAVAGTAYALRGGGGEVVFNMRTNNDPDMMPAAPGTMTAAVLEFVCAGG